MEPGTTALVADVVTGLFLFLNAAGFLAALAAVGIVFQMLGGVVDSNFVEWIAIKVSF